MNLQDEIILDLPIDIVRSKLLDEDTLVTLIANGANVTKIASGQYSASIPIAIFLLKSNLALTITIADQKERDSKKFAVNASGKIGEAQMEGQLNISSKSEEETKLSYCADVTVQGSIASVAGQYINAQGPSFVRKALEKLVQKVKSFHS